VKHTICDFNFFYTALLHTVRFGMTNHYRHIVVRGKENIPHGEHYIIAPTHQNALMDPLIVLWILHHRTVFLARADIFKKPLLRKIFTFLRIMPVYRIRDGRENLSNNTEIFSKSRQVLEAGVPLCLMAEGRHNDKHQLLPLVKGMFRIACGTQKELGDKPLYILPMGIDYSDYEMPYSDVCVEIGKPIDVRQYMAEYEEHEAVAYNRLRTDLTSAMKQVMHHVESEEHYAEEYAYCQLKTPEILKEEGAANNAWNRYKARQQVSRQMATLSEERRAECYAQGAAFAQRCAQHNKPLTLSAENRSFGGRVLQLLVVLLMVVAMLPLLPRWILSNPIAFLPTHFIPKRKIKDPQFRSSVNFGIRLAATMLYLLIAFVVLLIVRGFRTALVVTLVGVLSIHVTSRAFILIRNAING